jgi:hypothetical protein
MIGRRRGSKFCCRRCTEAAMQERNRRRKGKPLDRQPRLCAVCGKPFKSRRAHQQYCCRQCCQHALNQKQIAKRAAAQGRTVRRRPPSRQLIERRAAAVRELAASKGADRCA